MASKAIFKMAAARHLEFWKFQFWSQDCNLVHHLL